MVETSSLALGWRDLPEEDGAALAGKLELLYGGGSDSAVFDSLAVDKQMALLLFLRRLRNLDLWGEVLKVTNVYGEGGVGVEFVGAPTLKSRLRDDANFTARFATHRRAAEGYFERGKRRGALHVLRARRGGDVWSAHFDLYGPAAGLPSALRHLWYEKLVGTTPGWGEISDALGDLDPRDERG